MPQMSPMLWLILYIYFLLIFMLLVMLIYYISSYIVIMKDLMLKSFFKYKMMW